MTAVAKRIGQHPNGAVLIAEVFAIHRHGCPATRLGRTVHGPCDCGGDEMEAGFTANADQFTDGDPWRLVAESDDKWLTAWEER